MGDKRLALLALLLMAGLAVLFLRTARSWAQTPIPHAIQREGDCLSCHQSGVAGAPRVAWDHLGRDNEDCLLCHQVTGAPASDIPHPIAGRKDCKSCHLEGVGNTPGLAANHPDYANEECTLCHFLAPMTPTPIPTSMPTPTPAAPQAAPTPASAGNCVACHQLIFADEEHAIFTGQPLGDAQAGADLFDQLCVRCHGPEGKTPVGDDDTVINSEAYWGAHDDAAILDAIASGAEGEMPAFVETNGGPLSWSEVLDVAAFVRSWGPLIPPEPPEAGAPTYVETIGPLLTDKCGLCHGDSGGVTVTDYDALLSGPAIVPGQPEESPLVQVQRGEHYVQLSQEELDLVIEWIANDAVEESGQ
jgi:mono/diheme cytochrome c family protein